MASLFSSHCLCLLVLLFSCLLNVPSFVKSKEASSFNSMYFFGDIRDSSAANHMAATLNVPSPQPYTQEGSEYFESGLNFATPGATILRPEFFLRNGVRPPPQSHNQPQISTFMKFFYEDCFFFHDCYKNKVLQKALIFMDQPGINDYKHAFLHGKTISEVSYLVPPVVETIKNSVERLINDAGAKSIIVSASLPMGCFPGYRTLFPKGDTIGKNKCHKGLNMFSTLHNDHLWQALMELRLKYPEVQIIYADYYKAFMAILKDHVFLGFKTENLMKSCSGEQEGVATCSDRSSYIHWDGFRLTAEAVENLIDTLFSNKGFVFPESKFGEETTAAVRRQHSKIRARVRDLSSVVRRHLLFV